MRLQCSRNLFVIFHFLNVLFWVIVSVMWQHPPGDGVTLLFCHVKYFRLFVCFELHMLSCVGTWLWLVLVMLLWIFTWFYWLFSSLYHHLCYCHCLGWKLHYCGAWFFVLLFAYQQRILSVLERAYVLPVKFFRCFHLGELFVCIIRVSAWCWQAWLYIIWLTPLFYLLCD
jgi:hypothetical protein